MIFEHVYYLHFIPQNPPRAKSHPRAKATLLGLSTLRRDGDVTVNVMSAHTTVKAKFLVGPLMLKVEKEVSQCSCSWLRRS